MLKSFLATLAIVLASFFGGHYTNTISRQPAAPVAAVSSIQTSLIRPSATRAAPSSPLPTPHLFSPADVSLAQSNTVPAPPTAGAVLGTSTETTYVTQDELAVQIEQAANALRSLIYQNDSAPNSLPASGGHTNEIALSNNIDNLSGSSNEPLTISNATLNNISGLTAAEIPTDIVAANYLPLIGGTLTGSLSVPTLSASTTSYTNLTATNASTTNATSTAFFATNASSTNLFSSLATLAQATIGSLTLGSNGLTVGTNQLVVSGGNVGIGTTSLNAALKIDSTSTTGTILRIGNGSNGGHVYDLLDTGSANTGGAGSLDFFDKTAGVARLSIAGNGDVGIGTTTPTFQLSVYGLGQTTADLTNSGNTGGTLYLQDSGNGLGNGGALVFGVQQGLFAAIKGIARDGSNYSAGDLAFSTRFLDTNNALTERMRITQQGLVGIGTSTPSYLLDVAGQTRSGDYLIGSSSASPTVVYVGDSLTYGLEGTYPYTHYITLPTWNGQVFNSYNIGISGETVQTMFQTAYSNLNPLYATNSGMNIAVIWGGTNDLAEGASASTTYSYLKQFAQHEHSLGFKVLVATMISRTGQDANKNEYNALIRAGWPSFADGLIDLAANQNLGADGAYAELTYFYSDGIHLTDTGYALVGSLVQTALTNFINGSVNTLPLIGNVGIGTTTPGSELSIQNVGNFVANATSTLYNGLQVSTFNSTGLSTFASALLSNGTSTSLNVSTLGIGGNNYFTALNGVGLTNSSGSLAIDLTHVNSWTGLQQFSDASSTLDTISTLWLPNQTGTLLKANAQGQVAAAVAGTDYQAPLTFGYPLLNTSNTISEVWGTTTANTWSNPQSFTSGFISNASSTIGNGTQTGGLTINGGATTTGNLVASGGLNVSGSIQTSAGSSNYGAASALFLPAANFVYNDLGIRTSGRFYLSTNGATTPMLSMNLNGNVGIGTTTPYSRLEVWGPDTSAGTAALTISNNASTTELQVFDNGSATLAGTLTQSSDQRLKTNIQSLDASSSLSLIDALNPVTFNWADPTQASTTQLGFIAQDVQKIFPELVSMTAATALTPDGTLGLNYIGLIPPLVKAVQALAAKVDDLSNTVAGFALNLVSAHVTATVGDFDTVNAKKVNADELCVKNSDGTPICVTGDQLSALLAGGNTSVSASSIPSASVDSTTTPPVIQINGNNPAYINVGDSYADPGVTITGPQADLNLGIKTFLNGALVSNIVLDTSAVATDTIDYVAIDQADDTSTSTRTVIISPAVQADTASTTPQ